MLFHIIDKYEACWNKNIIILLDFLRYLVKNHKTDHYGKKYKNKFQKTERSLPKSVLRKFKKNFERPG